MLPNITRRADASDSMRNLGGSHHAPKKMRKTMLRVILSGKSEASTNPKNLQAKYSERSESSGDADSEKRKLRRRMNPRNGGLPDSKFVQWDEFSGRWRCNASSECSNSVVLQLSTDIANAISSGEVNGAELGFHLSKSASSSVPVPRVRWKRAHACTTSVYHQPFSCFPSSRN